MPIVLGLLCVLASLLLLAAVALMNFRFMTRLGGSEFDGLVLGTASVILDVMLAIIGALAVWGFLERRRLYAWSLMAIGAVFAALSFVSAAGFAAEGRDLAMAGRETERLALEAIERRLTRLEGSRKDLGKQRSSTVVEAELETLRGDERWLMSRQCTKIRGKEMGDWCMGARRLNAERATAKESERLDAEIGRANTDLLTLRSKTGGTIVDGQIQIIVEMTGWPPGKVRVALVLLVVSAMQLGAGFGLAIGLAPLLGYRRDRRQQRVKTPQLGEHLTWGIVGESTDKHASDEKGGDGRPAGRKNKRLNGLTAPRSGGKDE